MDDKDRIDPNAVVPSCPSTEDRGGTNLLLLAGLVVVGLLAWGLSSTRFLAAIADFNQIRGIITFIFAVLASAIIVITTVAIFFVDDKYLGRIDKARDLLTVVVGILGTIIGFYFGAGTVAGDNANSKGASSSSAFAITQTIGNKGAILVTITGAQAPFKAAVKGDKDRIPLAADLNDPNRLLLSINDALPCPAGVTLFVLDKDEKDIGSGLISLGRDELKAAGWSKCG
jgi:hypothetical protein